ncbi:MAG: hypothetical protein AMXMBFR7_21840 [Planctomycetota bacterium]
MQTTRSGSAAQAYPIDPNATQASTHPIAIFMRRISSMPAAPTYHTPHPAHDVSRGWPAQISDLCG